MDSNEVSTTSDEDDEEEELCSSHSIYDQQAVDSNAAFDKPVIVVYSSTSDEDV